MGANRSISKVILITGASSGMGRETALLLASKGYTVYAAARRQDKMQDLIPAGIRTVKLDVTDEAACLAVVADIMHEAGRIDVLVNNAGYGSYGAVEDVPLEEARRQFDVNVFGLAALTRAVLPHMRGQRAGLIVNVSSIGGKIAEPHGAWYHATKFAVEGFSDCLRMEVARFGIKVAVIEPGAIITEWNGIAREHLAATSGSSAYAELANKHIRMLERADKFGGKPIAVARAILRAVKSRHPATRYPAGGGAGAILFMRKILPDKWFDWVMLKMM